MQPTARAATNRANAQKSTGPRTEAGKKRSSLNALRHGLTGQTVVMPAEDLTAYTAFCKRAFTELKPNGFLEELAVQTIADTTWRLNRARAYESTLFSLQFDNHADLIDAEHPEVHCALAQANAAPELTKSLANLSTYEQRLNRTLLQAKKELASLQEVRQTGEKNAMDEAKILRKYHQLKNIDWQPKVDGFVFTLAEVDTQIRLEDRASVARRFVSQHYKAVA